MDDKQLIEAAKAARQNAHAPYSNYYVGAAIIDDLLPMAFRLRQARL